MNTRQIIQRSLSASVAANGAIIFPTMLIDKFHVGQTTGKAADQALEYYRSEGLFGERSTRNEYGYGWVIRSLNSEPPWVARIRMEEMEGTSTERESQLRPLTSHVQEASDETLIERFLQHLSERNARLGFSSLLDQFQTTRESGICG